MGPSAIPPLPPIPVAMHNCGYFTLPPMTKGRDCSRNRWGDVGEEGQQIAGKKGGGARRHLPPPPSIRCNTLLYYYFFTLPPLTKGGTDGAILQRAGGRGGGKQQIAGRWGRGGFQLPSPLLPPPRSNALLRLFFLFLQLLRTDVAVKQKTGAPPPPY